MNTYSNSITCAMILHSCVGSLSPWRVNFQGHRQTTRFFIFIFFDLPRPVDKQSWRTFIFSVRAWKLSCLSRVLCACVQVYGCPFTWCVLPSYVVCLYCTSHQPNWGPCMSLLSSGVSVSAFACFVCESGRQHCSQRWWRTHLHGLCTFPLRLPL